MPLLLPPSAPELAPQAASSAPAGPPPPTGVVTAGPSSSAVDFFSRPADCSHRASLSFGSFTDHVEGSPVSFWDRGARDTEDTNPSVSRFVSALVTLPGENQLGGLAVRPSAVAGPRLTMLSLSPISRQRQSQSDYVLIKPLDLC